MLWYVELKTGHSHRGPAWIGRIERSRTGRTIYFNGRSLKTQRGRGFSSNYYDLETGDEYWVSGVKRNGRDRHWIGGGPVMIDAAVVAEYLEWRGFKTLDPAKFLVVHELRPIDRQRFNEIENRHG